MPYAVITNAEGCDGFAVVKKGETKPVDGGCHDTRVKAMAHMTALNLATADEMEERATPNLVAPSFMKASARRGLALHEEGESGEGLKPATVADARRMVEGTALSEDKWRRIAPWIARHIVDLDAVQGDEITPGLVAMLLWGGGSSKESARRAQAYAERVVAQLDNEKRYDPDQPRDADGKFGSGSGGGDDDDLDEIDYDEFEAMVAEDEAAEAGGDTNDDDDSGGSDKPEWASDEDLGSRESADAAESKVIDEQESYLADLPQVADEALQDYTGNGHRAVNRGLRGAPPPPLEGTAKENAIEQGEWINDAIQNAPPLTSDAVVFRGMSMEALGIDPTAGGIDRQLDNLVGSSYRDDGIISTSFEREVAADFAMSAGDIKVAILVPKGSSALAVGALSQSYQERELLLPAGTEFEIVGLSGQGRGRTLYVEARTP